MKELLQAQMYMLLQYVKHSKALLAAIVNPRFLNIHPSQLNKRPRLAMIRNGRITAPAIATPICSAASLVPPAALENEWNEKIIHKVAIIALTSKTVGFSFYLL